jgi:hypothetical protein
MHGICRETKLSVALNSKCECAFLARAARVRTHVRSATHAARVLHRVTPFAVPRGWSLFSVCRRIPPRRVDGIGDRGKRNCPFFPFASVIEVQCYPPLACLPDYCSPVSPRRSCLCCRVPVYEIALHRLLRRHRTAPLHCEFRLTNCPLTNSNSLHFAPEDQWIPTSATSSNNVGQASLQTPYSSRPFPRRPFSRYSKVLSLALRRLYLEVDSKPINCSVKPGTLNATVDSLPPTKVTGRHCN